MSNARLLDVRCPTCGEEVTVRCTASEGWAGNWDNPPEPGEVTDWEDTEFNCSCREEIEDPAELAEYDATVETRCEESSFEFDEMDSFDEDYDRARARGWED